jgi:feruloyl esterase
MKTAYPPRVASSRRKARAVPRLIVKSLALLALAGATFGSPGYGQTAARDCGALAQIDWTSVPDAPTHILSAVSVAAVEGAPAHCRVRGYVRPNVQFELQLPEAWNGKFLMSGCGGSCGQVLPARCGPHLERGYACIVHDMGHSGAMTDSLWAYNNLQAEVDFGFRATHVAAVIGKAITERHYTAAPRYSYYEGCSTGGRQGIVAAQRYPADFDGIVAGAPIIAFAGNLMSQAWGFLSATEAGGKAILTKEDLQRVHTAVMQQCDAADGLEDGVLQNPAACRIDLTTLACRRGSARDCLSAPKIAALEALYRGPVDPAGRGLYPGAPMPGTERDWVSRWADPAGAQGAAYRSITDVFRYRLFAEDPGPTWQLRDFDWARDPPRLATQEALVSGMNPDLRDFAARGGKLIVWQGWNDTSVVPGNVIDYATIVTRVLGEAEAANSFRLYMLPGVQHCVRGPGADSVDYMTALEDWVERGEAPNVLTAIKLKQPRSFEIPLRHPPPEEAVEHRRPLFPWPNVGRYGGTGDPADPANWRVTRSP